jgi:hypothetical protein
MQQPTMPAVGCRPATRIRSLGIIARAEEPISANDNIPFLRMQMGRCRENNDTSSTGYGNEMTFIHNDDPHQVSSFTSIRPNIWFGITDSGRESEELRYFDPDMTRKTEFV